MKRRWLITLGLIGLGVVAFGIDAATAQTTANGPYYATPSWDQKLQCDTPATCPRFIVLANWNSEAVLDRGDRSGVGEGAKLGISRVGGGIT